MKTLVFLSVSWVVLVLLLLTCSGEAVKIPYLYKFFFFI